MAAGQGPGRVPGSFVQSKKYLASVTNVLLLLPQDARAHQVAVDAVGVATVGTATITVLPVGMVNLIPLLESDGATPVVLAMATGDARSDIRGSLQQMNVAIAGFDGAAFKLSATSYF